MVIRDSQDSFQASRVAAIQRLQVEHIPVAVPLDRIAAALIDYAIILLPFIYVAMAPFQRLAKEGALFDDQIKLVISTVLAGVAVVVTVLAYQTICVWLWGRTPGKLFLGLRVRSIWHDEKIGFTQALMRSIYWLLSFTALGLPFVAVFSNFMRRPLHDRITDTIVVSQRVERVAGQPNMQEISMAKGIYWAVGLTFSMVLVTSFLSQLVLWEKQTELISSLEGEDKLCVEVTDAQSEWPKEHGKDAERLSVAMSLYASGAIDISCLESEVAYLYADDEVSPMLSLAKSFVHASHQELSDSYLDQVCTLGKDSSECLMSRLISAVSSHDEEAVDLELAEINAATPAYVSVWAIRQYLRKEDFVKAQSYLERLPKVRALSDFVMPAQVKVLWGLNKREEALGISTAAYATLSSDAKLDISSFICFEQIWSNCSQVKSASCEKFSQELENAEDRLSNLKTSLAYLQKWECENSTKDPNYEDLELMPLHDDVKSIVLALKNEDLAHWQDLLDDETLDSEVKGEAFRRLIQKTEDISSLKDIELKWMLLPQTLSWRRAGESLFRKFYGLKAYPDSLRVVDAIGSEQPSFLSKSALEIAILAASKSGQIDRAYKIYNSYAEIYPLPVFQSGRMPASATSQELIQIIKGFLQGAK